MRASLARLPHRWRSSVLAALLACLAVYGVEMLVESALESEEHGRSPLARSIFELSGLYQRAVTVGWRKPEPRFTAIVELNVENDPRLRAVSVNTVCDQRAFLADLIDKLAAVSPAVIVLDKYFGADTCVRHPKGTRALQSAIANASQAGIAVVVGLYATRAQSPSRSGSELRLDPSLFDGDSSVSQGVVSIDPDSRRMALRWCGSADEHGATRPEWCETLAVRAARKYDEQIMVKYPRLEQLMKAGGHPYISFMRPEQFCRYAVLGDGSLVRGGDRRCPVDPENGAVSTKYMRGKVVLVGETSRDIDTHVSVVGPVSGVFMQANYMEALLDDRYFKPVPVLDYLFGISLFLAVTWFGATMHRTPVRALALILLSLMAMVGLVVGLIVLGGLYVNPVGVSVLALLFDGSHIALSWVFARLGSRAVARETS
jgi:CHASE2 domain-containing sensor protein